MSDADGDSQMVDTSSSDEADSEVMFPAEHDPPGAASHTLGNLVSEPSGFTPPHSQDLGETMNTSADNEISRSAVNEAPAGQTTEWVPKSDFAKSAAAEAHVPGAGWNNKKSIEEYQRANMQIEDKSFSLKEFGDLFDDTEQSLGNGKKQPDA